MRQVGVRRIALLVGVLAVAATAANAEPPGPPDPGDSAGSSLTCVVPNVKRKELVDALVAMSNAHCSVKTIRYRYSKTIRRDHVISQRPRVGTHQRGDANVTLFVSRGRRRY